MDYTWEWGNGITLMAEYYRDQAGFEKPGAYTLQSWIEYVSGELTSLGRDNLYISVRSSWLLLSGMLNVIENVNDGSALVNPWIIYSLSDDVELNMMGGIPLGAKSLQYGASPWYGATRLSAHF